MAENEAVLDEQLQQQLPGDVVEQLPFQRFYEGMVPALVELVASKRSSEIEIPVDRADALRKFMGDLYADAIYLRDRRRRADWIRDLQPALRETRSQLTIAREHVEESLRALEAAETALGSSKGMIESEASTPSNLVMSLAQVRDLLAEDESKCSSLIHPSLRSEHERDLACRSPYEEDVEDVHLPLRMNSAAFQKQVAEIIQAEVVDLFNALGIRVIRERVYTFVARFFWVALGMSVEPENVKGMLVRSGGLPKS